MAFQQGLSGLNAASRALDVISNNVANASTVGFKAGRAEFADVYAAALNGAAAGVQVGIGSAVSAVTQSFSQGNITTTNNPLDVAINGNGFFRLQTADGTIAYTRNGQFDINGEGFLVNAQGLPLTGYPAMDGVVQRGVVPAPIQLNYADAPPQLTTELTIGMNLDSRAPTPGGPAFDPLDPHPLDANNLTAGGYNFTTSATVYDSLGNQHTATFYFLKSSTAGEWDVYPVVDGTASTTPASFTLEFATDGSLTSPSAATPLTIEIDATRFGAAPADALDFTLDLMMNGTTQFGSAFGVNTLSQDGFAPGRLTGITIGKEGVIQGRYSNGASRDLGQIVLANFRSPNGLLSLGGNLWAESADSGPAIEDVPGSSNLGVLSAGSIEEANVDLTAELVQLIVQQRAYQANAQSVRAQDQLLQTIVNLR